MNEPINTYTFTVKAGDGHIYKIYGRNREEAYNNAFEKMPPSDEIIDD